MAEKTALEQFNICGGNEEPDPLERLRFFCSLAMKGQDWLDVEPFFDDVKTTLTDRPAADARFEVLKASLTEHEEEMLKLLEDLMEKVKEGKFDEVIHDSRDLANLAHKANDILDKLPKIK